MIDYTKYRKGTIVLSKPVLICPKCGRKGLRNRTHTTHKGIRRHFDFYVHIRDGAIVRDYCHVALKEEPAP